MNLQFRNFQKIIIFLGIFGGFFLFAFLAVAVLLVRTAYGAWQPIIGIPQPPFGVNEVAPATPSPWTSNVAGFYYVQAGGSNSGNGYPGNPRGSIPNPIPAGSVVEIHGQYNDSGTTYTSQGTSGSPVFVRGTSYAGRPKITGGWTLAGSYIIVENLWFAPLDTNQTNFGVSVYEGSNHIVIRNCEFSGNNLQAGGVGIGSWGYTGADSVSYMVVDNCYIHDLGQIVAGLYIKAHGITVNGSVDHLWVTNNELYHDAGDGMQIEAQNGRSAMIHHIYAGKNKSHHNKQTGMWVKNASDVIFSQNISYESHTLDSYSAGAGLGGQYDPQYVWFIANTIYSTDKGIDMLSADVGGGGPWYAIGNLIYNIVYTPGTCDPWNYGAIHFRNNGGFTGIFNTIDNVASFYTTTPYAGGTVIYRNNILSNRTGSCPAIDSNDKNPTLNYNLYSNNSQNVNYNGSAYSSISGFVSSTGQEANRVIGDPKYVSMGTDYSLQATSPAIDNASPIEEPAFSVFQARYGIDIRKDILGTTRPQGSAWDIGAYEYVSGGGDTTPPAAPTGLIIQ